MKNLMKITCILFAFTLLFTACRKDDDDIPKVAAEITPHELLKYLIIEEYVPKPEIVAEYGDKPLLYGTYLRWDLDYGTYKVVTRTYLGAGENTVNPVSYNAQTGITTLNTSLGPIELTRNNQEEIIIKNISHPTTETNLNLQYAQAIKTTGNVASSYSYKALSGSGYYKFSYDSKKWRYKQYAEPSNAELTWDFSRDNGNFWWGQDGGAAQLRNLFFIVPKGNGWKGNHKDKDLLLVNTLEKDVYKATGDIAIYELND